MAFPESDYRAIQAVWEAPPSVASQSTSSSASLASPSAEVAQRVILNLEKDSGQIAGSLKKIVNYCKDRNGGQLQREQIDVLKGIQTAYKSIIEKRAETNWTPGFFGRLFSCFAFVRNYYANGKTKEIAAELALRPELDYAGWTVVTIASASPQTRQTAAIGERHLPQGSSSSSSGLVPAIGTSPLAARDVRDVTVASPMGTASSSGGQLPIAPLSPLQAVPQAADPGVGTTLPSRRDASVPVPVASPQHVRGSSTAASAGASASVAASSEPPGDAAGIAKIYQAVELGDPKLLKDLKLSRLLATDPKNNAGQTPLDVFIHKKRITAGDVAVALLLIEGMKAGKSSLFSARGDIDGVTYLIEFCQKERFGAPIYEPVIKALIEASDVEQLEELSDASQSALAAACENGHTYAASLLIDRLPPATITQRGKGDLPSPLESAIQNGHVAIVEKLVSRLNQVEHDAGEAAAVGDDVVDEGASAGEPAADNAVSAASDESEGVGDVTPIASAVTEPADDRSDDSVSVGSSPQNADAEVTEEENVVALDFNSLALAIDEIPKDKKEAVITALLELPNFKESIIARIKEIAGQDTLAGEDIDFIEKIVPCCTALKNVDDETVAALQKLREADKHWELRAENVAVSDVSAPATPRAADMIEQESTPAEPSTPLAATPRAAAPSPAPLQSAPQILPQATPAAGSSSAVDADVAELEQTRVASGMAATSSLTGQEIETDSEKRLRRVQIQQRINKMKAATPELEKAIGWFRGSVAKRAVKDMLIVPHQNFIRTAERELAAGKDIMLLSALDSYDAYLHTMTSKKIEEMVTQREGEFINFFRNVQRFASDVDDDISIVRQFHAKMIQAYGTGSDSASTDSAALLRKLTTLAERMEVLFNKVNEYMQNAPLSDGVPMHVRMWEMNTELTALQAQLHRLNDQMFALKRAHPQVV